MTEIIDNFLTPSYRNLLENILTDSTFPWYLFPETSAERYSNGIIGTDNHTKDNPQFVHVAFFHKKNSDLYDHTFPVVMFLEQHTGRTFFNRLIRIKANLLYKNETYPLDFYNTPHHDLPGEEGGETLLYYVNDSDGDTFIFKEETFDPNVKPTLTIDNRVSPKKGRAVLFNSNILHAGSPPTKSSLRIVLNFVFAKG